MTGLPGTVSEKVAWRQAGWSDGRKGWPHRKDVPDEYRAVYLAGWAKGAEARRDVMSRGEER